MKKIAVGLVACWALLQAGAEEVQWLTDLPKAQAKAKAENKLIMLDFRLGLVRLVYQIEQGSFLQTGVRRIRQEESGRRRSGLSSRKATDQGIEKGQ